MLDLEQSFTGHLTINGRIYEILLLNPWENQEQLYINEKLFPQFPPAENLGASRAIYIENMIVQFSNVTGKVVVKVVNPQDYQFAQGEDVPAFTIISGTVADENYRKEEQSGEEKVVNRLWRTGYAFVFVGLFLFGMIFGFHTLQLLLAVLTVLAAVVKIIYEIIRVYMENRE